MRAEFSLTAVGGAALAAIALSAPPAGHALALRNSIPANSDKIGTASPRLTLTHIEAEAASREGLLPPHTRSVLNPHKRLSYGEYMWNDQGVPPGPVRVRVDLRRQLISVFRAGEEIGTAVVLYGSSEKGTPRGEFPILAKLRTHRSNIYDAPMPYTLRLTADGVAIHASDVRWGYATHGCIGVPTGFAQRLFDQAKLGDVVDVVESPNLT